jgi:uncharacterized protein Yka (UPF0111/DUF47 family)
MAVSLFPRRQKFFGLFDRTSATALEAARTLDAILRDPRSSSEPAGRLEELEHEGDALTHEILDRLNRPYVTPFYHEDIEAIARSLDDVIDDLEEAGQRVRICTIQQPREDASRLSGAAVSSTTELTRAFGWLRNRKRKSSELRLSLREIHRIEGEADALFREALRRLFEDPDLSAVDIVKWKDVYELVELWVDQCEKTGHVLGRILLKNI